ncbi:hypothetical protein BMW24_003485 [Mycobacterium heckeshornense]|uniref:hypothetical protein n=1 Tax=Mycobacterium heckeshornense TaxID=110505 RepID=UPI0008FD41A3|nr:hypothetical protein [Mycobacterium heckeshornense]PIJ36739.1 hypothetical protein BMW24_003200 [Mycobacterium heckeshornense]PIJ36790.1 hypothetical protein BMW24_003485 [Mycobacterium heckeshornense]
MTPFLDLQGFLALWDGPPLTVQQQAIVTLLLQVASQWIYANGPQGAGLPSTDPTAQFVVWDVVSSAVRYQRYSKLSQFSRTVGHRVEGGSFDDPMKALQFTDNHKMLLGIPLEALPMSSCRPNDFYASDQEQGWPTRWSDQFGNLGWDWWEYDND